MEMTATANEAGTLARLVGKITIAVHPTLGRIWFYVIAAVSETEVFGVTMGSGLYDRPGPDALTFATLPVSGPESPTERVLSAYADYPAVEALATFLRASGLTVPTSEESDAETRIREAVQAERSRLSAEFEAWKERATETAHEYANDNDLCGEFDKCMIDIGLRPRDREHYVEFEVTVTYRSGAYVTAPTLDDAAEMIDGDVWDYLDRDSFTRYGDVDVTIL